MRIHADPDLDPQPWKEILPGVEVVLYCVLVWVSLPGVEVVLCVGLGKLAWC